jgi:hypothetical protein
MLDGAARVKPLIDAAVEQGMSAIGITDHGNNFGAFDFYKTAKAAGIKPIIGIEAYLTPGTPRQDRSRIRWGSGGEDDISGGGAFTHMTMFAANTDGMYNLFRMSSKAWLDGFGAIKKMEDKIKAIDPSLYGDYLGIMAINDFMYFSMEQMIEQMSQTGQGVAGKVELDDADDEEGEEGEEQPDTKIIATGLIFPILCHEIIKGLEEAKGRAGLPSDPGMREKVLGQTDVLSNEPMQLRIGPEIVEKIRFALPDDVFDPEYKGLINFFHVLLYQIDAKEFLEIIGNAISEDSSKLGKAKKRFEEIVREAKQMQEEFENYKEEEDIDSDDDDGLDDFLSGLGITRPK